MKGRAAILAALSAFAVAAPVRAGVATPAVEGRVSFGYDSNLLDASTGDRTAFESGDPSRLFVVSSLEDEFLEGEGRCSWRFAGLPLRPGLKLAYRRQQYLGNPIKSSDRWSLEVPLRLASATRASLGLRFLPTLYLRHRRNDLAQPGEPLFRPEVQRRTDVSAELQQTLGKSASLVGGLAGSVRDERAPFDGRDRRLLGGTLGMGRSFRQDLHGTVAAGYARTWSRNDPLLPTDLGNREWTVRSAWQVRVAPLALVLDLGVELGWRRYEAADPADATHFGRRDRSSQVELAIQRDLNGALTSVTRIARQERTANIPVGEADDEAYTDFVVLSGIRWSPAAAGKRTP